MKNKNFSTVLCDDGNKNLSNWDSAIREAQNQILELKRSITTFREMKALGVAFPDPDKREPWPGTVEAGAGELKTAVHDSK